MLEESDGTDFRALTQKTASISHMVDSAKDFENTKLYDVETITSFAVDSYKAKINKAYASSYLVTIGKQIEKDENLTENDRKKLEKIYKTKANSLSYGTRSRQRSS